MEYQNDKEFARLREIFRGMKEVKYVLEIGSLVGDTLKEWLGWNNPEGRRPSVVSVDWRVPSNDSRYARQGEVHEQWPARALKDGQPLTVLNMDSTKPETIAKVRGLVPYLDFLFIDGGHDYATAKADFMNYAPLVRPGGVIAMHDVVSLPDCNRVWKEVEATVGPGRGRFEAVAAGLPALQTSELIYEPSGMGIGVLFVAGEWAPLQGVSWHVVTPFYRHHNLAALMEMWPAVRAGADVRWYPITVPPETDADLRIKFDWLFPLRGDAILKGWDPAYWKANQALESFDSKFDFGPNDYYGFLCDDDTYDPSFFRRLDSAIGSKRPGVIVVPARRWDRRVNRPNGTLRAEPENMRACHVGFEQFFIRGDIMEKNRFVNEFCADGRMVEKLYAEMPQEFFYVPDVFVNWNSLPA